jgi:hypothetical protein
MMRGKTFLVCIVTLLILLSVLRVIAQGPPLPPCVFYGYVHVGGKPAPDGLNVTAVISGTTLKWTTETMNGTYGWPDKTDKRSSLFEIPSYNASSPQKDGGANGDTIEFYVNGTRVDETATFESMGAKEIDLSISGTSNDNSGNGQAGSPTYRLLTYAALAVVVIVVGSLLIVWKQRRGNRRHVRRGKSTAARRTRTKSK